jgi:RHS repeat-associated protein
MFITPGANLAADTFVLTGQLDDTKGTTFYGSTSSYIENLALSNPGTTELDISDGTLSGSFIAARSLTPWASKASVTYDGSPSDSNYSVLAGDGSFPGGSSISGFISPATGTELTTNIDWEAAFSNSSLLTTTGSPITFRINENPAQSASGTLHPTSIIVSGPFTAPSPVPPAASSQMPKNSGVACPGLIGGPLEITFLSCGSAANAGTGNALETETDFTADPHLHLGLTRVYNGYGSANGRFGTGWSDTWSGSVSGPVAGVVSVTRWDGEVDTFTQSGSVYTPDPDVTSVLTAVFSGMTQIGWQVVRDDDSTEAYNMTGQLTSVTTRAGLVTSLTYTSGNLTTVTGPFGQTLTYTYDASNRVLTMTVPDTGVFHYAYDPLNNLSYVQYPDGKKHIYYYGVLAFPNLLSGVIDELGNMYASWTFDSTGRVLTSQNAGGANKMTYVYSSGSTQATDALGNAHTTNFTTQYGLIKPTSVTGDPYPPAGGAAFTYDSNGFVSSVTDWDGNVTNYVHNAKGEETSRTEAYGSPVARTITTTWHATFHLPLTITGPLRTTTFTYDANGNMLTKSVTDGTYTRTWTYTYNGNGQVLTAEDPDTNVTTFTYDASGNVATMKNALLQTATYNTYNADGYLTKMTDPNSLVTFLTYDARNRMTEKQSGSYTWRWAYDAAGNLTKYTVPSSSFLSYAYDAAHRPIKATDALSNYQTYTLDAMGNRTAENVYDSSSNLKRTHSYTYDNVNRVATDTGAVTGETTSYAYDEQSNLLTVTDPLTHVTTYTYDALNRLSTAENALSETTTTTHDSNDDITSVTDPIGNATTYTWDGIGDVLSIASADTGATTKIYDAAGNLLTSADARSDVTTYTYDVLNRPSTVSFTSGTGITYTYDAGTNGKGHLTSMTDATGHTSWTYDINGNVATKSQTTGTVTLTVDYNRGSSSELLNSTTYPSTRGVSYSYDTDKRILGMTSTSTLVASAAYFPFGPATGWTQFGSVSYGRPIDQDGRVSSVNIGGTVNVQTLSYDLASRLTGLTETGLSAKTYGYDNANRLTSLTIGAALPTTYTYDANGNRTSVTDPSSNVTTYNYPGTSNQLTSLSGFVSQTLSYDSAGNETGDGTNTYAYNARGRMSSVTVGGTATNYGVNGLGQRVTKSGTGVGGGGTNEYVYDERGHLLGEYNSTGQRIQETVYLNNTPVAVMTGTGTPTFYALAAGWQNTPHVIANSTGTFAWTWDRLGFGDNAPNQNPGGLGTFVYNPRLPGQLSDVESGLNYNMARDYNPVFGRYAQSDPIGLGGGINTYGYVVGNPLRYTDRMGLYSIGGGPVGAKEDYCAKGPGGYVSCGAPPSNSGFVGSADCGLSRCPTFGSNAPLTGVTISITLGDTAIDVTHGVSEDFGKAIDSAGDICDVQDSCTADSKPGSPTLGMIYAAGPGLGLTKGTLATDSSIEYSTQFSGDASALGGGGLAFPIDPQTGDFAGVSRGFLGGGAGGGYATWTCKTMAYNCKRLF